MSNYHSRASYGLDFPANLTPAEDKVVRTLLELHEPMLVARQHGVAISTVRTQLRRACAKAGGTTVIGLVVRYLRSQQA